MQAGIQKKIHGSRTTLIISNEEMNEIIKVVQALEYSNILLKGIAKTIRNKAKEQKGGFLSKWLCTLGASLLGNILAGKGIVRAGSDLRSLNSSTSYRKKKRKRNCKSWLWKRIAFLMLPHPLINFKMQKNYHNEPIFNGVYSRNNLPEKIKMELM